MNVLLLIFTFLFTLACTEMIREIGLFALCWVNSREFKISPLRVGLFMASVATFVTSIVCGFGV